MIRHYLVTGHVQGVGFRRFAEYCARHLGVLGKVRNLRDGRVEVVASGTPEQLKAFEDRLRIGPSTGRVDDMTSKEIATPEKFERFTVEKTGEDPWFDA